MKLVIIAFIAFAIINCDVVLKYSFDGTLSESIRGGSAAQVDFTAATVPLEYATDRFGNPRKALDINPTVANRFTYSKLDLTCGGLLTTPAAFTVTPAVVGALYNNCPTSSRVGHYDLVANTCTLVVQANYPACTPLSKWLVPDSTKRYIGATAPTANNPEQQEIALLTGATVTSLPVWIGDPTTTTPARLVNANNFALVMWIKFDVTPVNMVALNPHEIFSFGSSCPVCNHRPLMIKPFSQGLKFQVMYKTTSCPAAPSACTQPPTIVDASVVCGDTYLQGVWTRVAIEGEATGLTVRVGSSKCSIPFAAGKVMWDLYAPSLSESYSNKAIPSCKFDEIELHDRRLTEAEHALALSGVLPTQFKCSSNNDGTTNACSTARIGSTGIALGGGWIPHPSDNEPWLEFDLSATKMLTGLIISNNLASAQSQNLEFDVYISQLTNLAAAETGTNYESDYVFHSTQTVGLFSPLAEKTITFSNPWDARYVRLYFKLSALNPLQIRVDFTTCGIAADRIVKPQMYWDDKPFVGFTPYWVYGGKNGGDQEPFVAILNPDGVVSDLRFDDVSNNEESLSPVPQTQNQAYYGYVCQKDRSTTTAACPAGWYVGIASGVDASWGPTGQYAYCARGFRNTDPITRTAAAAICEGLNAFLVSIGSDNHKAQIRQVIENHIGLHWRVWTGLNAPDLSRRRALECRRSTTGTATLSCPAGTYVSNVIWAEVGSGVDCSTGPSGKPKTVASTSCSVKESVLSQCTGNVQSCNVAVSKPECGSALTVSYVCGPNALSSTVLAECAAASQGTTNTGTPLGPLPSPVVTITGPTSVPEGSTATLGVTVSSSTSTQISGTLTATCSVSAGTLSKTTATGTLSAVNAALQTIVWSHTNTHFIGAISVSCTVTTDYLETGSDDHTFDVTDVNDPPVLSTPTARTANEDIPASISNWFTVTDDSTSVRVTITLSPHGSIDIASPPQGVVYEKTVSANSLTIEGSVSAVNAAVTNLVFVGGQDRNDQVTVTVSVVDREELAGTSKTTTITITPQPDRPTLTVPPTGSCNERDTFHFTGNNQVTVADADNDVLTLTATVIDAHGTVTPVTTTGTADELNAVILSYTATTFPAAVVKCTVTDHTTEPVTGSTAITVNAVNDAPVITLRDVTAHNWAVTEDSPAVRLPFTVDDEDSAVLTVTISVVSREVNGFVLVPGTLNVVPQPGITVGPNGEVTVSGPNYAALLETITYSYAGENAASPQAGTHSIIADLIVTANDGEAPAVQETVTVDATEVDDKPTLDVPEVYTTNEEVAFNPTGIVIADADGTPYTVTVTFEKSTVTDPVPANCVRETSHSVTCTQAHLADIIATPPLNLNGEGADTVTVKLVSGTYEITEIIPVNINNVNDAPLVIKAHDFQHHVSPPIHFNNDLATSHTYPDMPENNNAGSPLPYAYIQSYLLLTDPDPSDSITCSVKITGLNGSTIENFSVGGIASLNGDDGGKLYNFDTTQAATGFITGTSVAGAGHTGVPAYSYLTGSFSTYSQQGLPCGATHKFAANSPQNDVGGAYKIEITFTDGNSAPQTYVTYHNIFNLADPHTVTGPGTTTTTDDTEVAIPFVLTDRDPATDRFTVTVVSQPSGSQINIQSGLTGTYTEIKSALEGITFLPPGGSSGTISYTVTIKVSAEDGAPDVTASATIAVTYTPDPAVPACGSHTVDEGDSFVFTDIHITDKDSATDATSQTIVTVTVPAGHGTLSFNNQAANGITGLTDHSVQNSGTTVVLAGEYSAVVAAVSAVQLRFTTKIGFSGNTEATITTSQSQLTGGPAKCAIHINHVILNQDPSLATPSTVLTNEDTAVAISVTVTDSDSQGTYTLVITATGGQVSLDGTTYSDSVTRTASTASGASGNVWFKPTADQTSDGHVSFELADLYQTITKTASSQTTVQVNAVNDPPTVATSGTHSSQRGYPSIIHDAVVVADIDNTELTVTVSTTNAADSINVQSVSLSGGISGRNTNAVTLVGDWTAINTALSEITYTAATDGAHVLTISAKDNGPAVSATLTVQVQARNTPTIAGPSTIDGVEGTPSHLSGFSVSDADDLPSRRELLSVTVSLEGEAHGSLSSTSKTGATVEQASSFINSIVFTSSSPDFYGSQTVKIVVSDGVGLTAEKTFDIIVAAVNDAPVWTSFGGVHNINEGETLTLTPQTFTDIDSSTITARISATTGSINIGNTNSVAVSYEGNAILVHGSIAAVNAAINTITYQAPSEVPVNAVVTIVGTLLDGALSVPSEPRTFTVQYVNDAPYWVSTPTDVVPAEGQTVNVGPWSIQDIDSPQITVRFSVEGTGSINLQTLTGTVAEINAQLATLTYTAPNELAQNSYVTIRATIIDGTFTVPSAFTLEVLAVNDAPKLTQGTAPAPWNEDTTKTITGFTVSDPDSNVSVTISIPSGTGKLSVVPGVGVNVQGQNTCTVVVSGSPTSVSSVINAISLTPAQDYDQPITVTVVATDGQLSDTKTAVVTITALNDVPTATAPAQQGTEDTPTALTGLSVDDVEDKKSGASVTVVVSVASGSVCQGTPCQASVTFTGTVAQVNTALAALTYAPASNANGPVTGTIKATDSTGATVTSTFTINVAAVNDAPTVAPLNAVTTAEDTSVAVPVTAADIDGPKLTVDITVSHGTLATGLGQTPLTQKPDGSYTLTSTNVAAVVSALATLTYSPTSNYAGSDTITVTVTDTVAAPVVRTGTITVTPVNDAPDVTTTTPAVTLPEDGTKLLSFAVTDIDSQQITVTFTLPSVGTLSFGSTSGVTVSNNVVSGLINNVNAAIQSVTFTPNADYNTGTSSITITATASDGSLTDAVTSDVTVTPVNDKPVLSVPAQIVLCEDVSAAKGTFSISDVDSSQVTVTLTISDPTKVTIQAISQPTGTSGYTLTTFSNQLVFTGAVAAVNDAIKEIKFTPAANVFTLTPFTLTAVASDAIGSNVQRESSVIINPINDGPTATLTLPRESIDEDTVLQGIKGVVGDIDNGVLSVVLRLNTNVGQLFTNSPLATNDGSSYITLQGSIADLNAALSTINFVPSANWNGDVQITLEARDAEPIIVPVTKTLRVNPVQDATQITAPATAITDEDTPVTIAAPSVSDNDGGLYSVSIAVSGGVLNVGTAAWVTGSGTNQISFSSHSLTDINSQFASGLRFVPTENYSGPGSVTIRVFDSASPNQAAAVNVIDITIRPVNDAPTFLPTRTTKFSLTLVEDTPEFVKNVVSGAQVTDIDTTILTVTIANLANAPAIKWSSTETVGVSVTGQNSGTIVLNGDWTAVNNALNTLVITTPADYTVTTATEIASFKVHDGALWTSQNIEIVVPNVNDAPRISAADQSFNEDTTLTFSVATFDPDTASLKLVYTFPTNRGTFTITHGGVACAAGAECQRSNANVAPGVVASITYVPTSNFAGSFTYTVRATEVRDGTPLVTTVTKTIVVVNVNDAPTLAIPTSTVSEDDPFKTILAPVVSDNNYDVDTATLYLILKVASGTLKYGSTEATAPNTVRIPATGTTTLALLNAAVIQYKPAADFNGPVTVEGVVYDGNLVSPASGLINVTPVNDAPVLTAVNVNGQEGVKALIGSNAVSVSDKDSTTLTLTLTVSVGGFVTGNSEPSTTRSFTGTPASIASALTTLYYQAPNIDYNGIVDVQVSVKDELTTVPGTFKMIIANVPDAPVVAMSKPADTNEDTVLTLPLITVTDADGDSEQITLVVKVNRGTLTGGSATKTYTGSLASVTQELRTALIFTPPTNAFGVAVSVTVDVSNPGLAGNSVQQTFNIIEVNDLPILAVPAATQGTEDLFITLTGAKVTDEESYAIWLDIRILDQDKTVPLGAVVKLATLNGITAVPNALQSDVGFSLYGTPAALSAAVATVQVKSNMQDWFGVFNVRFEVRDQALLPWYTPLETASLRKDTTVTVVNVNDPPVLGGNTAARIGIEDAAIVIEGITLADSDSSTLVVTIKSNVAGTTFTFTTNVLTATDVTLGKKFEGSVAALADTLSKFQYVPAADYFGNDVITITAFDGTTTTTATIQITITEVRPTIAPTAQVSAPIGDFIAVPVFLDFVDGTITVTAVAADGGVSCPVRGTVTTQGTGSKQTSVNGNAEDVKQSLAGCTWSSPLVAGSYGIVWTLNDGTRSVVISGNTLATATKFCTGKADGTVCDDDDAETINDQCKSGDCEGQRCKPKSTPPPSAPTKPVSKVGCSEDGFVLNYKGRVITNGRTVFTYEVKNLKVNNKNRNIRHFVLGITTGAYATYQISESTDNGFVSDPYTGVNGVRFLTDVNEDSSRDFTLSLPGEWLDGPIYWGVYADGEKYATGSTTGPVETCCASDNDTPPAPGSPDVCQKLKVCEHATRTLTCPQGQVIKIKKANYGRTEGGNVCPHSEILTTNCIRDAQPDLSQKCDGRGSCNIIASNGVFGDPCVNTYKYLDVEYCCTASRTAYICEWETFNIVCPPGETINIVRSTYGRTLPGSEVCPHASIQTLNCVSTTSMPKAQQLCNGKNSCSLLAANTEYTDPCEGTFKYLDVSWTCSGDGNRDVPVGLELTANSKLPQVLFLGYYDDDLTPDLSNVNVADLGTVSAGGTIDAFLWNTFTNTNGVFTLKKCPDCPKYWKSIGTKSDSPTNSNCQNNCACSTLSACKTSNGCFWSTADSYCYRDSSVTKFASLCGTNGVCPDKLPAPTNKGCGVDCNCPNENSCKSGKAKDICSWDTNMGQCLRITRYFGNSAGSIDNLVAFAVRGKNIAVKPTITFKGTVVGYVGGIKMFTSTSTTDSPLQLSAFVLPSAWQQVVLFTEGEGSSFSISFDQTLNYLTEVPQDYNPKVEEAQGWVNVKYQSYKYTPFTFTTSSTPANFISYVTSLTQPTGYCTVSSVTSTLEGFQNSRLCSAGKNRENAWRFTISFYEPSTTATWDFRYGSDSYGAVVTLDGRYITHSFTDAYWANDWTSDNVIRTGEIVISRGVHTLEVYGGEACCDQAQTLQFKRKGSDWKVVSAANLKALISGYTTEVDGGVSVGMCGAAPTAPPPAPTPPRVKVEFGTCEDNRLSKCSNGAVKEENICQNANKVLTCPTGQLIYINSASWGRTVTGNSICPSNVNSLTTTTTCASPADTITLVKTTCEKTNSCTLTATTAVFGSTCATVFKYLNVKYICATVRDLDTYDSSANALSTDLALLSKQVAKYGTQATAPSCSLYSTCNTCSQPTVTPTETTLYASESAVPFKVELLIAQVNHYQDGITFTYRVRATGSVNLNYWGLSPCTCSGSLTDTNGNPLTIVNDAAGTGSKSILKFSSKGLDAAYSFIVKGTPANIGTKLVPYVIRGADGKSYQGTIAGPVLASGAQAQCNVLVQTGTGSLPSGGSGVCSGTATGTGTLRGIDELNFEVAYIGSMGSTQGTKFLYQARAKNQGTTSQVLLSWTLDACGCSVIGTSTGADTSALNTETGIKGVTFEANQDPTGNYVTYWVQVAGNAAQGNVPYSVLGKDGKYAQGQIIGPCCGANCPALPNTQPDASAYAESADKFVMTYESFYWKYQTSYSLNWQTYYNSLQTKDQRSGYCTKQVSAFTQFNNQGMCNNGPNGNIAFHFSFEFYEPLNAEWQFRFGVDWHQGGGIYIDGNYINHVFPSGYDLWWAGSWANTNAVVYSTVKTITAGLHRVDVWAGETCCDGKQEIQFRRGSGPWTAVNKENIRKVILDNKPVDGCAATCTCGQKDQCQSNLACYWDGYMCHKESEQGNGCSNPTPSPANDALAPHFVFKYQSFYYKFKTEDWLTEETFFNAMQGLTQPAGRYCDKDLTNAEKFSNQGLCGANSDIAYKFTFEIFEPEGATWQFRLGIDWHQGGLVYYNDVLFYVIKPGGFDLWWEENWNHPAVQYTDVRFMRRGYHKFTIYASESCCDGNQWYQFSRNRLPWTTVSAPNLVTTSNACQPPPVCEIFTERVCSTTAQVAYYDGSIDNFNQQVFKDLIARQYGLTSSELVNIISYTAATAAASRGNNRSKYQRLAETEDTTDSQQLQVMFVVSGISQEAIQRFMRNIQEIPRDDRIVDIHQIEGEIDSQPIPYNGQPIIIEKHVPVEVEKRVGAPAGTETGLIIVVIIAAVLLLALVAVLILWRREKLGRAERVPTLLKKQAPMVGQYGVSSDQGYSPRDSSGGEEQHHEVTDFLDRRSRGSVAAV